ncbi:MAG: hypothetical protein J6S61_04335, partial [Elusimicrobiaceae bacterium]|nr:hypothetical protein [Elusimicrobiaceae bacterium]
MKHKIKNVLFMSFLGIACTTGNIFCAKIQERNMLNNESTQNLSTSYKEEINSIKNLLLEQIPIKQSPGSAKHEASKKLENVKNQYRESAKY